MALVTGSAPAIRLTLPSLPSCVSTASDPASAGPSTQIPGCRCVLIAAAVSCGTASLVTHSTGSPDLAAQAAAGMAYSGRAAEAVLTSPARAPAPAVCRRSTAAASAAGEAGATSVVL